MIINRKADGTIFDPSTVTITADTLAGMQIAEEFRKINAEVRNG